MKTVVVTGKAATTAVSMHHDGEMRWDSRVFHDLPKVLGNADPVRYAQMTPGIQTNSDMDAGLHIQGSDQTHNMFSIHEVPIYNAAHMLGIFSVFNASHYTAMTLKKHAQLAKDPARLGGMLNMELSETTTDSVSGEVAVGFISSQGTLRLPTGKRSSLTLSGRTSYLNLLYGRWLSEDDMQMKYSFFDANATWTWQPSSRHSVLADFYAGNDRMHMDENEYMARMRLRWGNTMAAVHVLSDLGGRQLRNSVYFTSYRNRLQLSQAEAVWATRAASPAVSFRPAQKPHGTTCCRKTPLPKGSTTPSCRASRAITLRNTRSTPIITRRPSGCWTLQPACAEMPTSIFRTSAISRPTRLLASR